MPDYVVYGSDLTSVADAIRSKAGTSASLTFPGGWISAISNINTGYTIADICKRQISGVIGDSTVSTIPNYAFQSCSKITGAIFSSCTTIGVSAFAQCYSLTTIDFSNCTVIDSYAFDSCSKLTSAIFPKCTTLNSLAFRRCVALISADFPSCTTIGSYAFTGCSSLTTINFSNCSIINMYGFANCSRLTTISFPKLTAISSTYAFYQCFRLVSLYLLGSSVVTLSDASAFLSTPISGYTAYTGGVYGSIYVPSSLLASYQSAARWSLFSSRFVGV